MSKNRSMIGVVQGAGSVFAKFSCRRGHPAPIIFTRMDRPMNALQLCCWQFPHKETL